MCNTYNSLAMTGVPHRSEAADPGAGARPLTIVLACPQCGAPSTVDVDAVSLTCGHCGSFLVVTHPGRQPAFTCDQTVPDANEVRAIVIRYRVQAYRAEVIARWGQKQEDGSYAPPSEMLMERKLHQYEEQLQSRLRVSRAFCMHVPYWHVHGSIVQAILGREHDGPKEVRVRAFLVEHTVPAYDEGRMNLRDRGLRMAGSRLQPLTRARARELGGFLPWRAVEEQTYLEIRKWQGRDLDRTLDPITKQGAFLFSRRHLVYRPYWLAWLDDGQERQWVLVDGTFGTIAGYPDESEAADWRSVLVPESDTDEASTSAVAHAARCSDCGADQTLDQRARFSVCDNCHLLLQPSDDGLKVVGYDHAAWGQVDLDGVYLPFWTFPFTITPRGGAPMTTLEAYAKALFPEGLPPGFSVRGDRLFVPAVSLLGTEVGDRAFDALMARIHSQPPQVNEGKLPLGGQPRFHGVTVPEDDAREAAPFALWALHGRSSAARLNGILVKRLLEDIALTVGRGRLVLLPFIDNGEMVRLRETEVEVPKLILGGGRDVDALRATVYGVSPSRRV
jgi:hypothetical protein